MLKGMLATFAVLMLAANLVAATWDEPFHRDVVAKADAFGLYEVVQSSGSGVVLKEVRHLAGTEQIAAYIPKAPATRVGLGFEIMDPRIGTVFPGSLKGALEALLAQWK
jgi:hypothetical protein